MSGNDNKSCRVIDKNFTKIVQLWKTVLPDYKEDKELFMKLLDEDFDINYKVPSGNTSFQTNYMEGSTIFQLVHVDIERCEALLNYGAEFTLIDKKGSTNLHHEAESLGYKSYLDSIGSASNTDRKKTYVNLILSAHISSYNIKNPRNKNGLSHFHIACMYNRADAANFFLENGVSISETVNRDSKFYPGFSALHFAVNSCAVETIELLLKAGADIFAQDFKGMNPLHLLIVNRRKVLINLERILRMSTNRNNTSSSKLQEHCNLNLKIIQLVLDRMSELECTVDNTGFSHLHALCFLGNISMIHQFLDKNKVTLQQSVGIDSAIWPGYTALHFAAHSNVETVELLVKRGADLSSKDANGITPFELCLKEFSIADVHRILLQQPDYFNITFSNNKTKLGDFIHAMQETATFESFLKNNLSNDPNTFVPFYSPICAGFTALHLVTNCAEYPMNWDSKIRDLDYLFITDIASEKTQNYLSRIEFCLRYNPNVTIRDARGLTPLHWAFKLQQSEAVHLLLEQYESNSNPVNEHGLSHLHIACAVNNQIVVKNLLAGGANANEVAISSYNWMNSGIGGLLGNQQLIKKYSANKGSTPLHFAATALCPKIIEDLIDHGADVLAQDANGLNPLEKLYEREIFRDSTCQKKPSRPYSFNGSVNETVKLLVKKIGDRLADTKPKQMLYCYSFLRDDLLSEVLSEDNASVKKILKSVGITPLHVACFAQNLARVNEFIDQIDVNARVDSESPLWPGCTPLHVFTMFSEWKNVLDESPLNRAIFKKLLQSGADVAAVNGQDDTPIHLSFQINSDFLDEMVNHLKDFNVNPMGKAGYTHLHIASAFGDVSIVERLLENGADVDYTADYFVEDFSGFTALHFAAFYHRNDVVDVLLKFGANVNWINGYGGNALHAANRNDRIAPCLELLRTLISGGADINLKDMHGETPLEALLKTSNSTKEEIELFLSPHSNFHTFNLMTDEGFLAIALNQREQIPVYDMAMKSSNVTSIDENGRNIIHNIVSFKRPDLIDGFDDEENEIDETYTPSEDYVLEIRSLVKLGLNIDQQDNKGFTPLHLAAKMQNLTGIIGLLENGADINITDSDGKPAFAYSFELAKKHEEFRFETLRKELKKLDRLIFKTIVTHVYKLHLTGIVISQSTREVVPKMREIQTYDATKIENCMNEIEEMKEQQFDSTSITFYEFLSDTGAVSNFPYFLSRQQAVISRTFENEIEVVREIFPELTGILLWQYRKSLARCNVIDSATSSLKLLVNFSIPPNILKMILRFFTNGDLSNLINSTTTK